MSRPMAEAPVLVLVREPTLAGEQDLARDKARWTDEAGAARRRAERRAVLDTEEPT